MSDLISRQAAIDAIERDAYRHTYLDQILDIIKSMPSAQPVSQETTAEWVPSTKYKGFLTCSACEDCYIEGWSDKERKWRYCPQCGVRLVYEGSKK